MKKTTIINTNLSPLEMTYAAMSRPLPRIEYLEGRDIPEPYKSLLVHTGDMTPTLEDFYQQAMELRVLEQQPAENVLLRLIILATHDVDRPTEFGAIRIHLSRFSPAARDRILGGIVPLGTIFRENNIKHTSNPQAFFKVWPDRTISGSLNIDQPQWLYGRHNIHRDLQQNILAEMVEILPLLREGPQ